MLYLPEVNKTVENPKNTDLVSASNNSETPFSKYF